MYSYTLKYKVELPEDTLWTEQVHELFFKSSYDKNYTFHDVLIENATKFIAAHHPHSKIHLEEIESLDVEQELD